MLEHANKTCTSIKDGDKSIFAQHGLSRPSQLNLYKKTESKNSVFQEHKTSGPNEDLLDAQIGIVNHN